MNHSHAPAIIDELYTSLWSLFYPGVNSRAEFNQFNLSLYTYVDII